MYRKWSVVTSAYPLIKPLEEKRPTQIYVKKKPALHFMEIEVLLNVLYHSAASWEINPRET
jgi:hypothetical protein